jgi:hypothetical protein
MIFEKPIQDQLFLSSSQNQNSLVQSNNLTHESRTSESITALLNSIFPEQEQDEKEIRQVKAILGELSKKFTAEELHALLFEIQYLVNSWLDTYEQIILDGKTLQQLLNEG